MKYNKNYETHGNHAIQLVLDLVYEARKKRMPLKAIHLQPMFYEWFKGGVQVLMKRSMDANEELQFDGVEIERGDIHQSKTVLLEYYES